MPPAPMPTHDVLCAGFVCVDLTLELPHHPAPDEKLAATGFTLSGGGPAANAAVQVARLGGRAAFAGRLGDDAFGRDLLARFAAEGVDTSACVTTPEPTPLAAVLVKPDGARNALGFRPATATPPPVLGQSLRPRVLLLDPHRPGWIEPLAAAARALGIPLVADVGSPTEAARHLAALADHVVASETYARGVLGAAPTAQTLASLGRPGATVVVTLGERGLLWSRPGETGALPAFAVEAIDTNGAGDAFHGAYALALAQDRPWPDLLRFASAAGALACTRRGSWPALPRLADINRFLPA